MSDRKNSQPLPDNVIAFDFVTRQRVPTTDVPVVPAPVEEQAPAKPKRTRKPKATEAPVTPEAPATGEAAAEAPKPKRTRKPKAEAEEKPGHVMMEIRPQSAEKPKRTRKPKAAPAPESPAASGNVLTFRPASMDREQKPGARTPLLPLSDADRKKLETFAAWIEEGLVTTVLNARYPDVIVPAQFSDRTMLHLNFSLRYRIPDFTWDEVGIVCSLSFSGQPFRCEIPWSAIYVLLSRELEQAMVEPASCPTNELPKLLEMFPHLVKPRQ